MDGLTIFERRKNYKNMVENEWLLKVAGLIAGSIIAYCSPVMEICMYVSFLIVADTYTGFIKYRRKNESANFFRAVRSAELFTAVSKWSVYMTCVMIAHGVQLYISPDLPIDKTMLVILCSIEFRSIDENIFEITGKSIIKIFISALSRNKSNINGKDQK